MSKPDYWDNRYRTIGADAVSWFEEQPTISLELLRALNVGTDAAVIDIGGGASTLVDHLLAAGHSDVTVLDLSSAALEVARARVGDKSEANWMATDLLTWTPDRQWDVWHDRAVLHFLTADTDRRAYAELLHKTVRPGGAFVIGVFAEDGPTECSALPVRRYTTADLRELLGNVDVVAERRDLHHTPAGYEQPFNWIAGRIPKETR